MLKLNMFLFVASLIVADEIKERDYEGILENAFLNKKASPNYKENSKLNIIEIEPYLNSCNAYINTVVLILKEKIRDINSPILKATHFAIAWIGTMNKAKSYLKLRVTPSLYPYLDLDQLKCMFSNLEKIYNVLYERLDHIHEQGEKSETIDASLQAEIDKITECLKHHECDLNKILFFSLITKSGNAAKHRRIHSKKINNLNRVDIKKECYFCHTIIKKDDYVFSLLCGHQLHITCVKQEGLVDNCPTCKQNIWDGVELKNSAFLIDN